MGWKTFIGNSLKENTKHKFNNMSKINFKEIAIPTGISKKNYLPIDTRETVANMIYLNTSGIRSHSLALKIYRSEGIEEYDAPEIEIILQVANKFGTPAFIDGLNEQLNNQ